MIRCWTAVGRRVRRPGARVTSHSTLGRRRLRQDERPAHVLRQSFTDPRRLQRYAGRRRDRMVFAAVSVCVPDPDRNPCRPPTRAAVSRRCAEPDRTYVRDRTRVGDPARTPPFPGRGRRQMSPHATGSISTSRTGSCRTERSDPPGSAHKPDLAASPSARCSERAPGARFAHLACRLASRTRLCGRSSPPSGRATPRAGSAPRIPFSARRCEQPRSRVGSENERSQTGSGSPSARSHRRSRSEIGVENTHPPSDIGAGENQTRVHPAVVVVHAAPPHRRASRRAAHCHSRTREPRARERSSARSP